MDQACWSDFFGIGNPRNADFWDSGAVQESGTISAAIFKFDLNSIGNAMMLTGSAYAGTQGFTNIASPVSQFLIRRTMTLPTMLILFAELPVFS